MGRKKEAQIKILFYFTLLIASKKVKIANVALGSKLISFSFFFPNARPPLNPSKMFKCKSLCVLPLVSNLKNVKIN